MAEEPDRDGGGDERVADRGCWHGLDQQRRAGVLEEEAARTVADRPAHVVVEVEGRHDDDGNRFFHVGAGEPAGHLQAVGAWHADVDEADVGSEALREGRSPPDRPPPRPTTSMPLYSQDESEAGADHRLVVGDEHPERRHRGATGSRPSSSHPPDSQRSGAEAAAERVDPLGDPHEPEALAGADAGGHRRTVVGDRDSLPRRRGGRPRGRCGWHRGRAGGRGW